jgi:hypothetical protein
MQARIYPPLAGGIEICAKGLHDLSRSKQVGIVGLMRARIYPPLAGGIDICAKGLHDLSRSKQVGIVGLMRARIYPPLAGVAQSAGGGQTQESYHVHIYFIYDSHLVCSISYKKQAISRSHGKVLVQKRFHPNAKILIFAARRTGALVP